MFEFLSVYFYIFIVLCIYLLVTSKWVKEKYNKMSSLYQLVSTTHSGKLNILYVSGAILLKACYYFMLQKINKSVVKVDKNKYELTYFLNNKFYKINVYIKKGPKRVIQVYDNDLNDITDIMEPYLGPNEDFHKPTLTPESFNTESVTFNLADGTNISFYNKEYIQL